MSRLKRISHKNAVCCRMIRKNLSGNKAVSLITMLFIAAASMLLSLSALLTANLAGAVEQLMMDAQTPHFMQMHTGDPGITKLEAFAKDNANVADFQVLNFLNLNNAHISIGGNSLAGSVQDNGVCVQSGRFDFLLGPDNQPVRPGRGEIYVPVCYYKDGVAKAGDKAVLSGHIFTVAGFVRDSQMNSSLASSKRFVVSEADYSLLEPLGTAEYLIEFRLKDLSGLGTFEAAYSAAGLASNGPALTWPLFRMISAVSDGIMIAVIVLVGILVIFIALLCVRFTLLAKIEDDYREIGVMKAVGMRVTDIRRIYLAVYGFLAAAGSAAGFLLSILLLKPLREGIRLNLGDGGGGASSLLAGLAGAALVFLLILLYVNWNLRRFHQISAVQAIRFGCRTGASDGFRVVRLSNKSRCSVNFLLAINDVLARKRLYATMLFVIMLSSFIMIVPQNLYHTISGEDFVTYIGVGDCDLRLDIRQTGQIEDKTAEVGAFMREDPEIADYALFVSKTYQIRTEDGAAENLKVELGEHTAFPLRYASGTMPAKESDIALSALNAKELGKNIGDTIILLSPDGERSLTVCGIYSDITNGGKTAKAAFADRSKEAEWSIVCANLADKSMLSRINLKYSKKFPYAKISGIDEYMAQTFGQTLRSVRSASLSAGLSAAVITLLVTLLFMKLLVAKDRYSISVLRAIGYTRSDIGLQYAWRAVSVLSIGIILGTVLAGTLGEKLAAAAISSFGAETFRFIVDPLSTYFLSPLILLLTALSAVVLGTSRAGDVKLFESIKE